MTNHLYTQFINLNVIYKEKTVPREDQQVSNVNESRFYDSVEFALITWFEAKWNSVREKQTVMAQLQELK